MDIQIIHNTFNAELLNITRNPNDNNFNLVMLANFYPEKDYITVIKAFALLKQRLPTNNIKLYCVGMAPGKGIDVLVAKCLVFDLKLGDDVIFTGKVKNGPKHVVKHLHITSCHGR